MPLPPDPPEKTRLGNGLFILFSGFPLLLLAWLVAEWFQLDPGGLIKGFLRASLGHH